MLSTLLPFIQSRTLNDVATGTYSLYLSWNKFLFLSNFIVQCTISTAVIYKNKKSHIADLFSLTSCCIVLCLIYKDIR